MGVRIATFVLFSGTPLSYWTQAGMEPEVHSLSQDWQHIGKEAKWVPSNPKDRDFFDPVERASLFLAL